MPQTSPAASMSSGEDGAGASAAFPEVVARMRIPDLLPPGCTRTAVQHRRIMERVSPGRARSRSSWAREPTSGRGQLPDAGPGVQLRFLDAARLMAVAVAIVDGASGLTAIRGVPSPALKRGVKLIGGGQTDKAGIGGHQILTSDAAYKTGLSTPVTAIHGAVDDVDRSQIRMCGSFRPSWTSIMRKTVVMTLQSEKVRPA